jgi:hypothetical protein
VMASTMPNCCEPVRMKRPMRRSESRMPYRYGVELSGE